MLNSARHLGIRPGFELPGVRRLATERRSSAPHKGAKRVSRHPKKPSIIQDYKNEVVVVRNPKEGQRAATHEERQVIHAYLIKERDGMQRKVAALHWASQARDLAFVKGIQDLETRSKAAKGLSPKIAGELVAKLKSLREISGYLPQSALELVFRLTSQLKEKKYEPFLEELISDFVANYNHYLDAMGDQSMLEQIPRHFSEDVAQGMNFELLKELIKRGNLSLITTFLSVVPIPSNVPSSLLNSLISIDPAHMTSRLAANYSPQQVTLACDKLLQSGHFELIPVLLNAVTTQVYGFENLEVLIKAMETHGQQSHWARLMTLVSPATVLDAHSYTLLAHHFLATKHWSHLQRILSMHQYNTAWASEPQLVALLNGAFHANFRQFAFQILEHLEPAQVKAIQTRTLDQWAAASSLASPAAVTDFLRQMTHILAKFKLSLPVTISQSHAPDRPSLLIKESVGSPLQSSLTPVSSSSETPKVTKVNRAPTGAGIAPNTQPQGSPSSAPVAASQAPSQAHLDLILASRIQDGIKGNSSSNETRREVIQTVKLYESHFPNQLNLGIWATYLICLCDELSANAPAESQRKELDSAARAFENFFLQFRPKLDDSHRQVLTMALTRVAQFLWSEGRHSSAMSLANVMSYYKLRIEGDFELLVREQASKRASVSGLAPLDWLKKAVSESAIEDSSFFNSLFSFIQSAVQFDMDEAIKAGGWKHLTEVNQNRSIEAWQAVIPIWEKAMKAKWSPSGTFLSVLFKLARLQPEPQISFFINALQYCQTHNLSISPTDLPMIHILELLLSSSNHTLGQYLLVPSGLNMISALPSNVSTKKSLLAFIMRCLADANDPKTAFFAYRLYSDVYAGSSSANFSSLCHLMVDAFFQICYAKRNFATAEKFARSLFPLHQDHNAYPIYLMLIELAGQCGELSSVIRLYKEASVIAKGQAISQLIQRSLNAVALCNVLPLESQRLRVKLEQPDVTDRKSVV